MLHTFFDTADAQHAPSELHRRHQALLAHRRSRSVSLGPCMWLQFEDELTVQHQIDELLRHRPVGSVAPPAALDAYAHLMPDGRQWKASLLLGLPDADAISRNLSELNEAARHLYVQLPQLPRVYAKPNEGLAGGHASTASAVHFLRFQFPPPLQVALLAGSPASIGCAHARYAYQRAIPLVTLEQLRCDLAHHPR